MLSLEVRKKAGGAEVHRVNLPALTVGASSGNEVVVRARGVAGRHFRIFEREGRYHLDLYKGVEAVSVNGREFTGGPIAVGDRITIGEATLTVLGGRPALRQTPVGELPRADTATAGTLLAVTTGPMTEVEYRALRLSVYRLCRSGRAPEELAAELVDFLDRELPPSEWAVGQWAGGLFRPLSSTFRETLAIPQKLLADVREGERLARVDTVTGMFSFLVEPEVPESEPAVGLFVREDPRLAARALLFLEELVQLAGLAMRPFWHGQTAPIPLEPAAAAPGPATLVPLGS
ncbi:MAG: FHA domain-containing protein, partial [Thermoanaerobaculia bacterium]